MLQHTNITVFSLDRNVIATKEVKRVTGFDGLEHVMISQDCQTDWDWVDVMTKQSGPSSRASFLRGILLPVFFCPTSILFVVIRDKMNDI